MTTYYIISAALYAATDWKASDYANAAPALIGTGTYAESYAVNTALLGSDACFEKFRALLEAQPTAELDVSVFATDDDSTTDADTATEQITDTSTSTN